MDQSTPSPLPPTAPDPRDSWASVYFIQMGYMGPIKIGQTSSIDGRIRELQVGSPLKLLVLHAYRVSDASGEEQALHFKFRKHRLHGEWFAPADELIAHIVASIRDSDVSSPLRTVWRGCVRDLAAQADWTRAHAWGRLKAWGAIGFARKIGKKRWEVDYDALRGERYDPIRNYCLVLREVGLGPALASLPGKAEEMSQIDDGPAPDWQGTQAEYAEMIGVHISNACRRLNKLVHAGEARRVGRPWQVFEPDSIPPS